MRRWIEYLISQPAALADFLTFVYEADAELKSRLVDAVIACDNARAAALAAETQVYANLRKKVEAEVRERQSVVAYTDNNQKKEE